MYLLAFALKILLKVCFYEKKHVFSVRLSQLPIEFCEFASLSLT